MKRRSSTFWFVAAGGLAASLAWTAPAGSEAESPAPAPTTAAARGAVRHVVLLAIAPSTPVVKLKDIEQAMTALRSSAGEPLAAEWGRDLTAGARTQGYTHALVLTFRDTAAVERYRASAAHRELVERATPYLAKPPLVLDYRVEEAAGVP